MHAAPCVAVPHGTVTQGTASGVNGPPGGSVKPRPRMLSSRSVDKRLSAWDECGAIDEHEKMAVSGMTTAHLERLRSHRSLQR